MIISQWTCDGCGRQAQTDHEEDTPSTPDGLYIPRAYLRTPGVTAEDEDKLKPAHDFWFCQACIDRDDDRIGIVILTKLRGLKPLRSI